MPSPLLFGAAFALNFVPYLGAALGVAVSFVVGLVSFEEPALAFAADGLYLAPTGVEGNVVTPYLVGRALRLNTVVVCNIPPPCPRSTAVASRRPTGRQPRGPDPDGRPSPAR